MDITKQIEFLKNQRSNLLLQLEKLSNDELSFIPKGSNNNILWNLGHILVIPQHHFYVVKGHAPHVEQYYIQNYMSGTRPLATDIDKEYKTIKELLLPTADFLKDDYDKGMFNDFRAFGNKDFIETLEFLTKHEAGHIAKINQLLNQLNKTNK
ncbi:MAG TPA: DinB family protein [Bacteroidia bacterium]|nr:DinB family protein [Bacteroidia bacterium]